MIKEAIKSFPGQKVGTIKILIKGNKNENSVQLRFDLK